MKKPKVRKGLNPLVRPAVPHKNRKRELKKRGPELRSCHLGKPNLEQEDT